MLVRFSGCMTKVLIIFLEVFDCFQKHCLNFDWNNIFRAFYSMKPACFLKSSSILMWAKHYLNLIRISYCHSPWLIIYSG